MKFENITMLNDDCMAVLAGMEDNSIDLVVSDPPYGIDVCNMRLGKGRKIQQPTGSFEDIVPEKLYFDEIMRVSKNQIIWGGNYFDLPPTRCNLIWDKVQEFSGADFELAWTSFDKPSKAFRMARIMAYMQGTIHKTQKPVKLYEWIYSNYTKPGDTILDTHAGSYSSAIAAHHCGLDYTGIEINKGYYDAAIKRFRGEIRQQRFEL